jgi:importin-4
MAIATEEEPADIDDDAPCRVSALRFKAGHTYLSPIQSALRIIDSLATNLPPTQIFPALRTLIQQYFSSADPAHRRAALLALGVSVEGCSEYMTPQMVHVWPMVEAGLTDGDPSVRKAACTAVSCLCEWLEDECAAKHTTLVPVCPDLAALSD